MDKKNRLRIFVFISVFSFAFIILVSNIVYSLSKDTIIKKVGDFYKGQLYQTSYSVQFSIQYLFDTAMQFYFDPNNSNSLFSMNSPLETYLESKKSIDFFRISSSFLDSIYLYNAKSERYHISGIKNPEIIQSRDNFFDKEVKDAVDNFEEVSIKYGYKSNALLIVRNAPDKENKKLYTLIFRSGFIGAHSSSVILNVYPEWIQQNVAKMSEKYDSDVFAIDENSKIVVGNDQIELNTSLDNESVTQKIIKEKQISGYFVIEENQNKYLYAYYKIDAPKWIFISKIPYQILVGELTSLQRSVTIITIIALMFALLIALILSKQINKPYVKLWGNFHEMEDYQSSVKRTLCSNFLRNFVMYGSEKNYQSFLSKAPDYKVVVDFNKPFCLVIFKMGWYSEYSGRLNYLDRMKEKDEILEYIKTEFCKDYKCDVFDIAQGRMGILISYPESYASDVEDQIKRILYDVLVEIEKKYTLSISALVSQIITSPIQLQATYTKMIEDLWYFKVYGFPSVISYNELNKKIDAEYYQYPVKIDSEIVENIKLGKNKEKVIGMYHDIINETMQYNYQAYKFCIMNLLLSIHKAIQVIRKGNMEFKIYFDIKKYIQNLDNYETVYEIDEIFIGMINSIYSQLLLKSESKQDLIAEKVKQIVEVDYANKDISIQWIADMLNFSPSYLNRVIRQTINETFTDYLNNFRLEKAAHILKDKKVSAMKVGDMVGYKSASYFSMLFKKQYGVTPADYRNNH